jgi:hypothetical protein
VESERNLWKLESKRFLMGGGFTQVTPPPRGKLAELFLYRDLEALRASGMITALDWREEDGIPDFFLTYQGKDLRVECKNIRSPARKKPTASSRPRKKPATAPAWKVEIQKTRNQRRRRQCGDHFSSGGPSSGPVRVQRPIRA